jgi:hypothetical protein
MQILFNGYSFHVKYNHIKLKTVGFGEVSSIQHCKYIIHYSFFCSDWWWPLRRKNVAENNRINFCVITGFITSLIAEKQNGDKLPYKINILFF